MNIMLKALSEKPQLTKDVPTLSYCKIYSDLIVYRFGIDSWD